MDIAEFGDVTRTDRHRHVARKGLYASLKSAFDSMGIAWDGCYHEDRGDGVLVLLDESVATCDLVTHLPRLMSAALREHNAVHSAPASIRLRIAVHAGETTRDAHGVVGEAVNHTFRILDAGEVKTALARSANVLAFVVSARFFTDVVRNCPSSNADAYRRVEVAVKETRATAWLLLPDPDPDVAGAWVDSARVRDLDDPVSLGVHPSPPRARHNGGTRPVPTYVVRDAAELLTDALTAHPFVVLVGDATAGKTRLAYEVIRATLPDHLLLSPGGPHDVTSVLARAQASRACVVWLDDLERFLGPDGLTAEAVSTLIRDPGSRVVIVATMRSHEHARLSPRWEARTADEPGRLRSRTGRNVIRLAHEIYVARRWSDAEVRRARASEDPRVTEAVRHADEFGVAEYLAAGPQLLAEWRDAWAPGHHPRAAALVAAAVDASRAGVRRGVTTDLLRRLHGHYLSARGGASLRPEPFDVALSWASEALYASSGLLVPVGRGRYRAFGYLIDTADSDPDQPRIPAETWRVLVSRLTPAECWQLGEAAYARRQLTEAVAAFRRAADAGDRSAEIRVADCVGETGLRGEALTQIKSIVEHRIEALGAGHADTIEAEQALATWTGRVGDFHGAVGILTSVVDRQTAGMGPGHPLTLTARHALAHWEGRAGHAARAVAECRRIIESWHRHGAADHPFALAVRHELANWLARTGDVDEAMRVHSEVAATRSRILGADHADTLHSRHRLARMVCEATGFDAGLALFAAVIADRRRVLGTDHPDTLRSRAQHARWTGKAGRAAEAVTLYKALIDQSARALGPNHPDTLRTRHMHARWLAETGDNASAVAILRDVVEEWTRTLGAHHPYTLASRYRLARATRSCGETVTALRILREVHADNELAFGSAHHHTRDTAMLISAWQ